MQITMKLTSDLHPDPNQPRKIFDEIEEDRLGDDMLARGVLVPLLVGPDGMVRDGERRLRAALRKGITKLPVIVSDKVLSQAELLGIQLATVCQRTDLKPFEKWQALEQLKAALPGQQMKELAGFLHIDPSAVTKWLSPSKCIAEAQQALRDGKIGLGDCYEMSRVPAEQQRELLQLKLAGTSRDGLAERVRKQRKAATPQVRQARVVCPLASGTRIVVTGPEMDLEGLIEALQAALDAARKANKEAWDLKTAERVWKDKAKAG